MCIAVCTIVNIANHFTTVTITTRFYRPFLSVSMSSTSTVKVLPFNEMLMDYIRLVTGKA